MRSFAPTTARGTVFHFVTDGIEAALERAYDAADGQDVRLAGGVSTIQQFLRAGLVDEMHLAYAPLLLGSGERLFDDLAERTGRVRDCRVRRYAGRAACPLYPEGCGVGIAASRNELMIGTKSSLRFTNDTCEVPGSIAS